VTILSLVSEASQVTWQSV